MTFTLTQKEQEFSNALDQTPDDWELRGIYADWLSDQGRDQEEACQRWMIENKRRPYPGWYWFMNYGEDVQDGIYERNPSYLNEDLFNELSITHTNTREEAEHMLLAALTRKGIIP